MTAEVTAVVTVVLAVAAVVSAFATARYLNRQQAELKREQAELERQEREIGMLLENLKAGGLTAAQAEARVSSTTGLRVPEPVNRRRRLGQRLTGIAAWRITDLAAILAGRRRPGLREEWRAHLAGEAGQGLPIRRKVTAAGGFVAAAVRYRLQDLAELAWIPADAVLKSGPLSNLVVWIPTVTATATLFRHIGTVGVLASAESIAAVGGSFYALIRVGRWWRGVKPQEPKARRGKAAE